MQPNVITDTRGADRAAENNPVLTTATVCFFVNDGDWTEHPAPNRARKYTANSDTCLFRLYKVPCRESIAIDRGPDEQIQFRAGATILGRRAPGWEWETRRDRRLLFIFDEADVIARPHPRHRGADGDFHSVLLKSARSPADNCLSKDFRNACAFHVSTARIHSSAQASKDTQTLHNTTSPPVRPPMPDENTFYNPTPSDPDTFRTESLELAAYLLARGHQLVGTDRVDDSPMVIFVFPGEAAGDTASFFSGTVPLPPIKIFEAHRTLRMMVSMMKGTGGVARRSRGVA